MIGSPVKFNALQHPYVNLLKLYLNDTCKFHIHILHMAGQLLNYYIVITFYCTKNPA